MQQQVERMSSTITPPTTANTTGKSGTGEGEVGGGGGVGGGEGWGSGRGCRCESGCVGARVGVGERDYRCICSVTHLNRHKLCFSVWNRMSTAKQLQLRDSCSLGTAADLPVCVQLVGEEGTGPAEVSEQLNPSGHIWHVCCPSNEYSPCGHNC